MNILQSISAAVAIAVTDLKLLLRDKLDAFFTFVFPLIFAIFFGWVFGGAGGGETGKIELGIVQLDKSASATAFADDLAKLDGFHVTRFDDVAKAQDKVRKGELVACVVIPEDFNAKFEDLFATGAGPTVRGYVDPSRRGETGLLEGRLTELAFKGMTRSFSNTDSMKKQLAKARESIEKSKDTDPSRKFVFNTFLTGIEGLLADNARRAAKDAGGGKAPSGGLGAGMDNFRPVKIELEQLKRDSNGPTNSYEVSLPQGIVWGLMGCVTAFVGTLAVDRQRGTLVRLMCSPLSTSTIIAGKSLAGFVSCMAVQWLLIGVFAFAFKVRVPEPLMLLLATTCASLGFVGLMMFLAVMGRASDGSGGMGRAVVLVLAMIGGGTIPVFIMPKIMQTISGISPFSWAVRAVEGATWRSMSLSEIMLPCGVLLAIGAVGFTLGAMMFRRNASAH
ncbi:MAG: ABC transporter permease [Phycisphaerales bacterium]|nr:ABC transporter permease [Phycisphaerales bacterium]